MRAHYILLPILIAFLSLPLQAQKNSSQDIWAAETFKNLKFRHIGPALMSGRIADIAIHPDDDNHWYIAVGSGGVWKTTNAGVTWTPIFDKESSYSIGCVSIDPNNPHIVWVGTGENVGGRHVGYGDGVYRSDDGGKTWTNMGLMQSEHISKIIVHPENSDIVWVAAQGPLWNKGGHRGLYKTTDGGKTWKRSLGNDEWTGVTDIAIDPRNPDRLYAATWDRHRTVAAYMGGGPGSGLHRSTDGGNTWEKLSNGLPKSNMGKIGLAISPQQPDVLYAAIELDQRSGGVYRSTDQGKTWKKRSDAVSGATGPHYYQELYACPHQFDRLYLVDVRMQISDDGGKTFRRMKEEHKHSDNHALAFRKDDPDYLLVGTDGGLYESFDLAENWRFMANLPLTQFYKIAVDDAEPFYNVYGGTQDNSTEGGPSRTDKVQGIENADWSVVLNWDGHQPATEPGNPDIMYGQRQEGTLARIDLITGEVVDIQPQPDADEDYERFNWDAPILVSPHSPTRIYFGSQRLWVSDNRGDDWQSISGDLTRNQERLELPIMGKKQSWDNPWDMLAMSNFNTITSIAESPQQEGLIFVGTDDGLIAVTENGGKAWRTIDVSTLPGVPAYSYVNDIKADLHDANTLFVALDNHKQGDFTPYVLKSTDRGQSWTSLRNNLPDRTLIWRIVQDHEKPELLFLATEFGIYFSPNGGNKWVQLKGGLPTISFRDLTIQRRENDLVVGSFGRGIYILDDFSALREVSAEQLEQEATLFSSRQAWWFIPRSHLGFDEPKGDQGAGYFTAPNPPHGAVFTYYLQETYHSSEEQRKEKEKALSEKDQDIPFPGWEALDAERMEAKPKIWLEVSDSQGNVVRRVQGPVKKGFHRVAWDLRYPSPTPIRLDQPTTGEEADEPAGMMAAPGTYKVQLFKQVDGTVTALSKPREFKVVPLRKGALEGADPEEVATFWRKYELTSRSAQAVQVSLANDLKKIKAMQTALQRSNAPLGELDKELLQLRDDLMQLDVLLNGNRTKQKIGEKTKPTVGSRLFAVSRGISSSTYGPTNTTRKTLSIAVRQLNEIRGELESLETRLTALGKKLVEQGAPWVEGEAWPKD